MLMFLVYYQKTIFQYLLWDSVTRIIVVHFSTQICWSDGSNHLTLVFRITSQIYVMYTYVSITFVRQCLQHSILSINRHLNYYEKLPCKLLTSKSNIIHYNTNFTILMCHFLIRILQVSTLFWNIEYKIILYFSRKL